MPKRIFCWWPSVAERKSLYAFAKLKGITIQDRKYNWLARVHPNAPEKWYRV